MLNDDLEFTPQTEIRRLKRIIDEKQKAIDAFKEYDKKRTNEYNRLVENYNVMQEQFDKFCDDVRKFEEIDGRTKDDFLKLFHGYYKKVRSVSKMNGILNDLKAKLNTIDKAVIRLKNELLTLDRSADKVRDEIGKYKDYIEKRQSEWK